VRRRTKVAPAHKTKVRVIMDYEIFRKQAYLGTGCQRDSIPEVTDSNTKGDTPSSFCWLHDLDVMVLQQITCRVV